MSDISNDSTDAYSDSGNASIKNTKNYQITEEYQKNIENINYYQNVKKQYMIWKEMFTNYIDKCIENFNNNCKKLEDMNNKIKNNLECEITSPSFQNNFKKDIYQNLQKEEIEKVSNLYLQLIDNIKKNNCFSFDNKKPDKQILKKIEEMKKIKLIHRNEKMNSEYICFSPLNDKNYILFGNKNGEVEIYDFNDNQDSSINEKEEKYKLKLRIKVFNKEVKYICELDEDLFAVSGRNNEIKIIECKDDISKYSIIQTIYLDDYDDSNIYSMISLPLLSSQKESHFLSIATEKNILIFKSNKTPKNLNTFNNENNEKNLFFELYKNIELNTLTHCLIEVDNKYLVAACPNEKTIKFFDMNNDFKQVANINEIKVTRGSSIFTVIPNENILIVACDDGFKFISIKKMKKYKSVHCSYSVLSLDMIDQNTIICCCSEKNKNVIKQYQINNQNFELKKKSQRANHNNDEIWKLKKINERIFFIDNQNIINFLV